MKFERDEIVGMCVSVGVALLFFVGLRFDTISSFLAGEKTADAPAADSQVVTLDASHVSSMATLLRDAVTRQGKVTKLIIEDTKVGTGTPVQSGSSVKVNYVGMLQDGTQFDNSYTKGEPYPVVVGAGAVIKGWDLGLIGMKAGGERILVVPPDMAYGDRQVGPIPPNSTLLFSVELMSVE